MPTILRESLKMSFAVAVNEGFRLRRIEDTFDGLIRTNPRLLLNTEVSIETYCSNVEIDWDTYIF